MWQLLGGSRPPRDPGAAETLWKVQRALEAPASNSFPQRRGEDRVFGFGASPVACKNRELGGNRSYSAIPFNR